MRYTLQGLFFGTWCFGSLGSTELFPRNPSVLILIFMPPKLSWNIASHLLEVSINFCLIQESIFVLVNHGEEVGTFGSVALALDIDNLNIKVKLEKVNQEKMR